MRKYLTNLVCVCANKLYFVIHVDLFQRVSAIVSPYVLNAHKEGLCPNMFSTKRLMKYLGLLL